MQHWELLSLSLDPVLVDVVESRIVCVKPYPQFVPLFRMDGLEEREDGCFYSKEEQEVGPTD
jgi:hypothetical protein